MSRSFSFIAPTARDFPPDEAIFCRNTLGIARKNGAQQVEKARCLGVLTVSR